MKLDDTQEVVSKIYSKLRSLSYDNLHPVYIVLDTKSFEALYSYFSQENQNRPSLTNIDGKINFYGCEIVTIPVPNEHIFVVSYPLRTLFSNKHISDKKESKDKSKITTRIWA